MKIGILTHHYVVNFGAFLQAYALQEAVKKLYPQAEVQIINYLPSKHFTINTIGWFLWYKNRQNWKNWGNVFRLPYTLMQQRSKHMNLSPLCFSAKDINRQKYDAIIIGSDELWNYADPKSVNPLKFSHQLECKNIIAYAPSAGNSNIEDIPQVVTEGLKRFKHLSGRDDRTVRLAEKATGRKTTKVLDPTFLYPLTSELCHYKPTKDYILFYYCEHLPKKIKKQIFRYAKDNNLRVIGAGDSDKDYDECTVNMTPFEWIDLFKDAKFVFTGTFHGAVFSILNRKQFKVYLTNPGRVAKVGELLNGLGIAGRLMGDDYQFDLMTQSSEIDYDKVYTEIEKQRATSLDYLKTALK